MDKIEQITTILNYLNHKMRVMDKKETDKVKKILQDDDITLTDVVYFYMDFVDIQATSVVLGKEGRVVNLDVRW
jgi:hypothetical protein